MDELPPTPPLLSRGVGRISCKENLHSDTRTKTGSTLISRYNRPLFSIENRLGDRGTKGSPTDNPSKLQPTSDLIVKTDPRAVHPLSLLTNVSVKKISPQSKSLKTLPSIKESAEAENYMSATSSTSSTPSEYSLPSLRCPGRIMTSQPLQKSSTSSYSSEENTADMRGFDSGSYEDARAENDGREPSADFYDTDVSATSVEIMTSQSRGSDRAPAHRVIRSFHSTPDCKSASSLSSIKKPGRWRNYPSSLVMMPRRVSRDEHIRQLRELELEGDVSDCRGISLAAEAEKDGLEGFKPIIDADESKAVSEGKSADSSPDESKTVSEGKPADSSPNFTASSLDAKRSEHQAVSKVSTTLSQCTGSITSSHSKPLTSWRMRYRSGDQYNQRFTQSSGSLTTLASKSITSDLPELRKSDHIMTGDCNVNAKEDKESDQRLKSDDNSETDSGVSDTSSQSTVPLTLRRVRVAGASSSPSSPPSSFDSSATAQQTCHEENLNSTVKEQLRNADEKTSDNVVVEIGIQDEENHHGIREDNVARGKETLEPVQQLAVEGNFNNEYNSQKCTLPNATLLKQQMKESMEQQVITTASKRAPQPLEQQMRQKSEHQIRQNSEQRMRQPIVQEVSQPIGQQMQRLPDLQMQMQPAMCQPLPLSMNQRQHSMGQQQYSMGQPQYSMGHQQHSMGVQQHSIGQQQYAMGHQQHSMGQQQYSIGQQQQQQHSISQHQHSIGQQQHSMGVQQNSMGIQQHSMGVQQNPMGIQQHSMGQLPMTMNSGAVGQTMPSMMTQNPFSMMMIGGKHYVMSKLLGKGGSSQVFEAICPEFGICAIKMVDLGGEEDAVIEGYKNEIELMMRLQTSGRVVKLYDHEYRGNQLIVVMERGETDLDHYFRKWKNTGKILPEMIKFYWRQMLEAVQVLHDVGIVHSDLKPANFLLVAGVVKLIDFGIAKAIQSDRTSVTRDVVMGTLNYLSPESILDTQNSHGGEDKPKFKLGVKSDIWSLGCILYTMVYGRTPFQHIKRAHEKLQAITSNKHPIQYQDVGDQNLVHSLQRCLVRNPRDRAGIQELLSHAYLTTNQSPASNNVT